MTEPEKRPVGRPPKKINWRYADRILEHWAVSRYSLERTLEELRKSDPRYPSLSVVYSWTKSEPEFTKAFARAKEFKAHYLDDKTLDIANDTNKGAYTKKSNKAGVVSVEVREDDNVARSRLQAEVYSKRAAHLFPKEYRDRNNENGSTGPNEQLEALHRALMDGPIDTADDSPAPPSPGERDELQKELDTEREIADLKDEPDE